MQLTFLIVWSIYKVVSFLFGCIVYVMFCIMTQAFGISVFMLFCNIAFRPYLYAILLLVRLYFYFTYSPYTNERQIHIFIKRINIVIIEVKITLIFC